MALGFAQMMDVNWIEETPGTKKKANISRSAKCKLDIKGNQHGERLTNASGRECLWNVGWLTQIISVSSQALKST